MKKLYRLFCIVAIAFVVSICGAESLKEGRDYAVLKSHIPNAQNTVIEIYSYACPFCAKYAKITPDLIQSLPKGVAFKPYHLRQMGEYGTIASQVLAVAITLDNQAKISIHDKDSRFYKVKNAYFYEYHTKRTHWTNAESFLQTGLNASGISKADYEKTLSTNATRELLEQWELGYEAAKINGIPAFVVNGKYLIYTKSIASPQDLESKIKELLKK